MNNTSSPSAENCTAKWRRPFFRKGSSYRDFTPAHTGDSERSGAQGTWLFNPGCGNSHQKKAIGAAAQEKSLPCAFACRASPEKLCASPTPFMANRSRRARTLRTSPCCALTACQPTTWPPAADDADLRISHIIRGQDHLSNTYKHVLIFEAAGFTPPQFAHLPLLVAPDGTKLSKRRHGPS